MGSYYYFAASLPMLMPDEPPPFSVAAFREQCETHLSPHDMAALNAIVGAGPEVTHPFARTWKREDAQLRNALARVRAERMRKDAGAHVRESEGIDFEIEQAVGEAYTRSNPLEREKALDRIRWHRLEQLAGMDPFAGGSVLAYGLQLSILERWERMDKDAGAATVDTLVQRSPADEEDKS